MKTIYKYPIKIADTFSIPELPQYATIIHVGLDPTGQSCFWAEVFTEWVKVIEKYETSKSGRIIREFAVVGTGHEVPPGQYIASWVSGLFVWHLYETTKNL